ncbi:hypothetical protein C8R45DRAFT_937403 [Mycena sanguinolenta]|nr:hypothetical protein C8R45DRAFT_937403 [Mycena sanguinolenta]
MRASEIVTKTVGFGNPFSEDQELLLDPFPKPINSIEKWVLGAQKPKVSWAPETTNRFWNIQVFGATYSGHPNARLIWRDYFHDHPAYKLSGASRQPALLAGDDPTGAGKYLEPTMLSPHNPSEPVNVQPESSSIPGMQSGSHSFGAHTRLDCFSSNSRGRRKVWRICDFNYGTIGLIGLFAAASGNLHPSYLAHSHKYPNTRYPNATLEVCSGIVGALTGCVTVPLVLDPCIDLIGGLSGLNKEISSAVVPHCFVCQFFQDFECITSGVNNGTDSETTEMSVWGRVGRDSFLDG